MNQVSTTSRQRTSVRAIFGLERNTSINVKVVPGGRLEPRLLGEAGGHFTRGGQRIYHPSAYGRRGWGNMVYVCSTRRIAVGELWLRENV